MYGINLKLYELFFLAMEFKIVRNLNEEKGFSIATSKKDWNEIALGLTNGQIQILNHATNKLLHTFDAG